MPPWQRFLDCTEQTTTLGPHRSSSVSNTCSQVEMTERNSLAYKITEIQKFLYALHNYHSWHVSTPGWHDAKRTWFSVIFIVFLYCYYKLLLLLLLFFGTWSFCESFLVECRGRVHLYIFKKGCTKTTVTCYNPISKLRDNNEREVRLPANSGVFSLVFFWISFLIEYWFISKELLHNKSFS